jgi:Right handed beta helix region
MMQLRVVLSGCLVMLFGCSTFASNHPDRGLSFVKPTSAASADRQLCSGLDFLDCSASAITRSLIKEAPVVDATLPISVLPRESNLLAQSDRQLVDTSRYPSLAAAVTMLGSKKVTLIISSPLTVESDLFIPATAWLKFISPGQISVGAGKVLTIAGLIEAPAQRIFVNALSNQGTVVFSGSASVATVYPQWWGANPDGVTDNTAMIQAALTAGAGRKVELLPGRADYKISRELILSNDTEFLGSGGVTLSQVSANHSGLVPATNNYIHDVTLRGAYGSRPGSPGIRAAYIGTVPDVIHRDMTDAAKWNGYGMRVEHMLIRDWGNNGVWAGPHNRIAHNTFINNYNEAVITFGDYTIIDDNEITGTQSWGIDVNGSYCQITNNRLSNVGNAAAFPWDMGGIAISTFHTAAGASKNQIKGNTINNSDGHGILVIDGSGYACDENVVSGNRLTNVAQNLKVSNYGAIEVVNSFGSSLMVRHTIISGNTIKNSKGAGIELVAPSDVQVSSNIIEGVASSPGHGDGIRAELATPRVSKFGSGVVIKDNTISSFYRYGINIDGITDVTIERNRVFDGNWDGPFIPVVRLNNTSGYVVSGNHITGKPQFYDGIVKFGSGGRGTVSDNTVEGCHVPIGYYRGWQPPWYVLEMMYLTSMSSL